MNFITISLLYVKIIKCKAIKYLVRCLAARKVQSCLINSLGLTSPSMLLKSLGCTTVSEWQSPAIPRHAQVLQRVGGFRKQTLKTATWREFSVTIIPSQNDISKNSDNFLKTPILSWIWPNVTLSSFSFYRLPCKPRKIMEGIYSIMLD